MDMETINLEPSDHLELYFTGDLSWRLLELFAKGNTLIVPSAPVCLINVRLVVMD